MSFVDPGWNPAEPTSDELEAHMKAFFENNVALTEQFTPEELMGENYAEIGAKLCDIYLADRWEAGL